MAISLVTGASRGIGLEVARQLGKKGHTVLLGVRNAESGKAALESLRTSGLTQCDTVTVDVTKSSTIARAATTIGERFGRLDVLVNNAGIAAYDDVTNVDLVEARRIMDTNFFGVIEVTNHMLPWLRKSDAAQIVNVSSILGSLAEHSDPNAALEAFPTVAYSASKAALNMYTVQLARALRKDTKIRVNAVHPGWIKSDMGNMLGAAPSELEHGAKQIVDFAHPTKGPTGGYYHQRFHLRW